MEFLLVFILQGLLVDACHKIIYGKRTILSYLPVTTNYVFGKCACDKMGGLLVAILGIFSSGETETLANGEQAITYNFGSFGQLCSSIFSVLSLVFFALLIYRVVKAKKNKAQEIVNPNVVLATNVSVNNDTTSSIPVVDVSKYCECGYVFNENDQFCPRCGNKKEQ